MIDVFMAVVLGRSVSFETVHREVVWRLDPRDFRVYAFIERMNLGDLPSHITPIMLPRWKQSVDWLGTFYKGLSLLPKILSIPHSILHTVADPRLLLLRRLRKASHLKDKHVITFHGVPFNDKASYIAGKLLSKDADAVVSISKYTAQLVETAYGVDSHVIYGGVDTNFFKPKDHHNDRPKILFVGKLRKIKRPWYVVKLAKDFPQCDFSIYGSAYGKGDIKLMIENASRNLQNVKINPPVPHEKLRYIYSDSDIFLFPSIGDALGLVILEAAASGLPIICSNSGGAHEFVEHGKQGLLFDNYKEAKEALSYLLENENVRKIFSIEAREKALDFDWGVIAKQYSDLYKQILN